MNKYDFNVIIVSLFILQFYTYTKVINNYIKTKDIPIGIF